MAGTDADDDRFIEEWRPLVVSIAEKLRIQLDLSVDPDDLLGFGFTGLVEARARYDASRGVQFKTFAYYRIRGAIMDGVREMAWLPRRAHAIRRAAEGADRVLEAAADARAAAPPAARQGKADAVEAIDDTLGKMVASYVMASLGQDEQSAPPNPEERLLEARGAADLRAAVEGLPERERALVHGFYLEGRRFDEIAEELGISKSWASRLHTKALGRLRAALDSG